MIRIRVAASLLAAALPAVLPLGSTASAQSSLEDALRQFTSANARGYLQPVADLFAADMASGWYGTANLGRRFGASIELVGAASAVRDKHRSFTAVAPEGFTPETFETATVFGGEGTEIDGPNGTSFRGSDGILDADYLPTVVPQLRVAVAGTEGILRYFSSSLVSTIPEEDFPETKLLGFGLRHSVSQYLPLFPVDLSAGLFYSSVEIGSEGAGGVSAKYTGLGFGIQASKSFSILTLYAGAGSDGGEMELGYVSTNPEEPGEVSVVLDVERSMRFTVGAALGFGFARIAADVNLGPVTTFSGGLRLGL